MDLNKRRQTQVHYNSFPRNFQTSESLNYNKEIILVLGRTCAQTETISYFCAIIPLEEQPNKANKQFYESITNKDFYDSCLS